MNKLIKITASILLFIFASLLSWPVRAYIIDPSSGTKAPGSSTTFLIYYQKPNLAPSTINGVAISILVHGGSVTSATPVNSGGIIATDNCPGGSGVYYVDNLVCYNLASGSQDFTDNQYFGSFVVHWDSTPGTNTIIKTDNSFYTDSGSGTHYASTGTIGTFVISADVTATPTLTPTTGTLPVTSILNNTSSIIIGFLIVSSGVVLYVYSNKKYVENDE